MGQFFKYLLSSPWVFGALLFLITFFGVKNLKILQGFGPPKVKRDPKTGAFTPDNTWRNRVAVILGLGAVIGVPVLTRTGGATISFLGWAIAVALGAIAVDQGFAKLRDSGIPKLKKAWQEYRANKGRKS